MSVRDAFTWRPYPNGTSRCQAFADSMPPLDDNYRPAPGADAELVSYVEALRRHPINRAAYLADTTGDAQATGVPVPSVSVRARHAATTAPVDPTPAGSVAVLDPPPRQNNLVADVADDLPPAENTDDPGYNVYEPIEGDDYVRDRKGRRVFAHISSEGADFVAVDQGNHPFTDADGNLIFVTTRGIAVDDRTSTSDVLRKLKNLARSGGATTAPLSDDTPQLYDENGAPVEHFEVPPVGSSPTISHRMLGGRRLGVMIAITMVFAVVVGGIGMKLGRGAVPAQGSISAEEADTYRLSDLPVDGMASFGQQYLQLCLTHGMQDQVAARATLLAAMSTGGAGTGCGWSEGGKVQAPQVIVYTGRWKPLKGFATGRAAVLDYNVTMDGLRYSTYSVPIWVNSASTSNDMSVVGLLGIAPGIRNDKPENYKATKDQDPVLAAELQGDLLPAFLKAWAASDPKQIALTAAHDATPEVRSGLGGVLTNPTISRTLVFTNYDTSTGTKVVYTDGDVVEAVVIVDWEVPASQSTQTTGYRVALRRASSKWEVTSIYGGAVTDQAADPNRQDQSGSGINRIDAGLSPTGGPASTTETSSTPQPETTTSEAPTSATESSDATP